MSNKTAEKKQWGARFESKTDPLFEKFTSSISYDKKLAPYDIQGSIAHTQALILCGVLTKASGEKIITGLKNVLHDIISGHMQWDDRLEDIHTHIEVALRKKIGSLADKLHTARSRNDQVVTDLRLYLKEASQNLDVKLNKLQEVLWHAAVDNKDVIIPGYTHLRRAQPVLLAHHWLSYMEMFQRDRDRIQDAYKRIDVLPLGSCALAGTSINIDRHYVAKQLGFSRVSENSMDAVSDRDFVTEVMSAIALIGIHLSRLSEELLIWSTEEFNYIKLPQSFCSGSSAMPHKMNPDIPELIRGKSARLIGNLMQNLTMQKALPLTYNRDLQEDKMSLFDSVESALDMMEICAAVLSKTEVNEKHLKQIWEKDYSWALDLAEFLVRKGLEFRKAHEVVGRLVLYCDKKMKNISDLTLDEVRLFSPHFDEDYYKFADPAYSVKLKLSMGSTSPQEVSKQLRKWKKRLRFS
ncbi:MAG: argininosuccinate lyase [Chlamydiota bacterium]|nr:argininosuccinate lyase [Chlamydiota bacterium]